MTDTGRTTVITGSSSGFRAAAVRAFADSGDRIWGTMRVAGGRIAGRKTARQAHSLRTAIAERDATSDTSAADRFVHALADAGPGRRPTRTVVGIVDEVNAFTQPQQNALPKEMRLDTVPGGADA